MAEKRALQRPNGFRRFDSLRPDEGQPGLHRQTSGNVLEGGRLPPEAGLLRVQQARGVVRSWR